MSKPNTQGLMNYIANESKIEVLAIFQRKEGKDKWTMHSTYGSREVRNAQLKFLRESEEDGSVYDLVTLRGFKGLGRSIRPIKKSNKIKTAREV